MNGKMTEVCAAMGLTSNWRRWTNSMAVNRRNYEAYFRHLKGLPGITLIQYDPKQSGTIFNTSSWSRTRKNRHLNRDDLVAALHAENVLARKYFWPGCHRMKPYQDLFPWADMHLPQTNSVAGRVIVLPTGTVVSEDDAHTIGAVFPALHRSAK